MNEFFIMNVTEDKTKNWQDSLLLQPVAPVVKLSHNVCYEKGL